MGKKNEVGGELERRFLESNNAEIRLVKEGDVTKIIGYAAKFNSMSNNLGWFRETIEPGFFNDALSRSDNDPVDLFNHDDNFVLGRKSAGTLRVWEDTVGLGFECQAPDTQIIRELVLSPIERKDITGCSFGFSIKSNGDMWDEDEEGRLIRTLKKDGCSKLWDVSQVTYPAYPETNCALRSFKDWTGELSDNLKKQRNLLLSKDIRSEEIKKLFELQDEERKINLRRDEVYLSIINARSNHNNDADAIIEENKKMKGEINHRMLEQRRRKLELKRKIAGI